MKCHDRSWPVRFWHIKEKEDNTENSLERYKIHNDRNLSYLNISNVMKESDQIKKNDVSLQSKGNNCMFCCFYCRLSN